MFLGEQGSTLLCPIFLHYLFILIPVLCISYSRSLIFQARPWDCPAEYEAPGAFLSPIVLIIQNTVFNLQTFKVKLGTAVTLEGDSTGSNNQNTVIEAVM